MKMFSGPQVHYQKAQCLIPLSQYVPYCIAPHNVQAFHHVKSFYTILSAPLGLHYGVQIGQDSCIMQQPGFILVNMIKLSHHLDCL